MAVLAVVPPALAVASPVQRDGDECEDADVDAEQLHGRTELAHELGKVPALKQRSVKLHGKKGEKS